MIIIKLLFILFVVLLRIYVGNSDKNTESFREKRKRLNQSKKNLDKVAEILDNISRADNKPKKIKPKKEIDYLQEFDKIIKNDTTYPVSISEIDINSRKKIDVEAELTYNPKKKYDNFFFINIFCDKKIDEELKINFIKDAQSNNDNNLINKILKMRCPCLETQHKLGQVLFDIIKQKSILSKNSYDKFKYLDFVINNNLKNKIEIIEEYFYQRALLFDRYHSEDILILHLIRTGKFDIAFRLTKMLFQEIKRNNKQSNFNNYSITSKNNLFANLYFYGNDEIKKEVMEMGFYLYETNPNKHSQISILLKNLANKKYKELLIKLITKFDKNGQKSQKDLYRIFLTDGILVAQEMGYDYWKIFTKIDEFKTNKFTDLLFNTAMECSKGIKNKTEIKKILDYIYENHTATNMDFYRNKNAYKYIQLILKSGINSGDYNKYKFKEYSDYDWNYALNRSFNSDNNVNNQKLSVEQKKDFYRVLMEHNLMEKRELDDYDKFLIQLDEFKLTNVFHNLNISFDTDYEAGEFPVNYKYLFNNELLPFLKEHGIYCLSIEEEHIIVEENLCEYKVSILNNSKRFEGKFLDDSDFYNNIFISKLINMALKDAGVDIRLINTYLFGMVISNPNNIFPAFEKLNEYAFALYDRDNLIPNKYIQ